METNTENAVNELGEEINEKIAGITLYDNEAGTNTSPMNLTESSANFKYIDIQYKLISSNTTYYSSTRIYEPNQKEVALNIYTASSGGADSVVGTLLIAFNEATATMRRNYTFVGASKGEKEMFITKIVGYK